MWSEENFFLQGPYEPLFNEQVISELRVEGHIPVELSGTLYGILFVDRHTGEATWLHPENSQYMLGHFLNAYQEGENTIIDASIAALQPVDPENYFPPLFPLLDGPSGYGFPQLWRFLINPKKGSVEHRQISDFPAEFARPNETFQGQRHRYGYMVAIHAPGPGSMGFNCLAKHDYETGETRFQYLSSQHDLLPGEPVFVRHPQASREDGRAGGFFVEGIRPNGERIQGDPASQLQLPGEKAPPSKLNH